MRYFLIFLPEKMRSMRENIQFNPSDEYVKPNQPQHSKSELASTLSQLLMTYTQQNSLRRVHLLCLGAIQEWLIGCHRLVTSLRKMSQRFCCCLRTCLCERRRLRLFVTDSPSLTRIILRILILDSHPCVVYMMKQHCASWLHVQHH